MLKRAVVLLSGGLDSATTLAFAMQQGFTCFALSVDYGQKHRIELQSAAQIADTLGAAEHKVVRFDLTTFGGSALTDDSIEVPTAQSNGIPSTYVPARNTIMLSLALAWSEVIGSRDIFIGANAVDYSGYPDCRPEYIEAFAALANLATKAGVEGARLCIHAPLVNLGKAEIIQLGVDAGVDFSRTVSCYQPNEKGAACRKCDSCRIRRKGFEDAGIADPTIYVAADPMRREL